MSVGVAVVGTGFGCLTHVRALRAAGFEVRALVGRDPAKTASRARRFEIEHASTSLGETLAHGGIDAVTIATPPNSHGPLVLDAVRAGKHVVCEKPFARDAPEARRLLAAAERAGIVHLLGTEFRFAPGQALLTRVVLGGAVGEPRLATFLLHIPLLADPDAEVPAWWSDAGQGGGWLGAHASHVIDQIHSMLGAFGTVSASLPNVGHHPWSAEDAYLVHFRLREGCTGLLQSVASDRGPMLFATRVVGTRGTAWAEGDRVFVADADGTREIDLPPDLAVGPADPPPADLMLSAYDLLHSTGLDVGPYTRLFEQFRARIEGATGSLDPAPATFVDGVATMEVIDAIRRSAREGQVDSGTTMTGVVVVGTGFGCFTHVRALQAAGFDVRSLVGRNAAKTARRAAAVGVPDARTSLRDALEQPGVDAVTIATPPHTHAPLVVEAIRAGKHVLCEKPFARDAIEARALLAAAEDAGVVHILGTEFRFDTGQALLARTVRDGAVGEPRLAIFVLHVPVLADPDADLPDWWADASQGGGWLGAHGSQVIDQIRVTLGEFDAADRVPREHRPSDDRRRRVRRALPHEIGGSRRDAEHRRRPRAVPHRNPRHRHPRHRVDRESR